MTHVTRDYRKIIPDMTAPPSDTCRQREEHPVTGQPRPHNGVDLPADVGSPIFAPQGGTVERNEFDGKEGGFGHYLVLKHPGPGNTTLYTLYAHLAEKPALAKGDPIKAGDPIASSGTGGTGPHLHYEERVAVPDANGNIPTWDKAWPIDPDLDLTGMSNGPLTPPPPFLPGGGLLNRSPCLNEIPLAVPDNFVGAENFIRRRDPLTFDLDGDGIETVGINPANPILFDHDGDGLKTATGWIAPDDAFLVLDRDGNGTIDDGTELFGDSTSLLAGGNAADGFAALQDQDTNQDGVVDSNDASFTNLRLWRDLNQNGLSETNELLTLVESGIAAITVGKTENSTLLPNGNVLADLGHYTKTDGTTGGLGTATGQLGDVDLREDTFHSEFTDAIPLTPEAESLPDMHCIDRNLQQININQSGQVGLA